MLFKLLAKSRILEDI